MPADRFSLPGAPRVAFQGERGAFGDEAARRWRADAVPLPVPTFDAVPAHVVAGAADAGVLPVENRIAGPVAEALAAGRWGLTVLARGVQDVADNWTRFVVVARSGG